MMNERKGVKNKICAPFLILKVEKMYYAWVVSFIIAFFSIIYDWLSGNISGSFEQGAFYSTSITILAPFLVEFFVEYTGKNRSMSKDQYTTYKSASLVVSLLCVLITCLLYASQKTNVWIQVITTVLVAILSSYLYLVSKMDNHSKLLVDYADVSYDIAEKETLIKMSDDAKKLDTINSGNGMEIKL